MKLTALMILIAAVGLSGCGDPIKRSYIKTERGLLASGHGYCVLGMLTNNSGDNILNEESEPITCSGYIKLTTKQLMEYKTPQMEQEK